MTFQDHARQRTESALESLRDRNQAALRQELDALRLALEERMMALEAALSQADGQSVVVDGLVQELNHAASEDAEALAARTRTETEERLQAAFAETQAEARRELEIERGANAELHASLSDARRQVDDLQGAARAHADAQQQIDELRRAAESHADVLRQIEDLRSAARSEADARTNLEAALERARTANAELTDGLASAQAAASVARDEAERHAADVEAARGCLQTLEAEIRELRRAREDAEARLAAAAAAAPTPVEDAEAPVAERVKHALRAFGGATSAQAIFDALVEQLAHEFAAVALFLNRRNRLEGWRSRGLDAQTDISNVIVPLSMDSPLARAVASRSAVTVEAGLEGSTLGVFGKAVAHAFAWPIVVSGNVVAVAYVEEPPERSIAAGSQGYHIAEILVEQVGRCLVTGRKNAAAAESGHAPKEAAAPEIARPAAKAVAPAVARPAGQQQASDRPTPGISPTAPETTQAASSAPKPASVESPAVTEVGRRGAPPSAEAAAPFAGPAREVDRVKIRSGVEVSVDGTTGQLVDLSTCGAQVLSPRSIRPQQLVRIVLQGVDGPLACKGRIVWARFEKTRSTDPGMYRAGVRFSEADPVALQAFLDEYGEAELALPARAV